MPAKASAPKSTPNAREHVARSSSCSCGCGPECECQEGFMVDESELNPDLLPHDDTEILAAFFQALANPSRLNIVFVLLKYKQLSVSDIAQKTRMSISAVSHQLAMLRMRKLVTVRRDGVKNFYALCDDHVSKVIEMAIDHIHED